MLKYFQLAKTRIALTLFLLSVLAILNYFSPELLLRFILITTFTLVLEYILWKLRGIEPFAPISGVVSSEIIFLLSDKSTAFALTFLAVAAAIASKQFLRDKQSHIFNPAAFGLVIAGFFGLPISWWGVSSGIIPLFIILLGAGHTVLFYLRQHLIIFSFLTVSLLIFAITTFDPQFALNQLLVSSFWFFVLVMLPEPITAAHKATLKPIYGALVALLSFILPRFLPIPDSLLTALLVGNLALFSAERLKTHS